jgi:AraC-like DNA-binding protein
MEVIKLEAGKVDPDHLIGLIGLTGIVGKAVIEALHAHLVKGLKKADACREFGVSPSLLSRKVNDLNKISNDVRRLAKFYR